MWKLQPWSVEKHLLEEPQSVETSALECGKTRLGRAQKCGNFRPWSVEKQFLEEPKRVETSALECGKTRLGRAQKCGNFSPGVWKNISQTDFVTTPTSWRMGSNMLFNKRVSGTPQLITLEKGRLDVTTEKMPTLVGSCHGEEEVLRQLAAGRGITTHQVVEVDVVPVAGNDKPRRSLDRKVVLLGSKGFMLIYPPKRTEAS